MRSVVVAHYLLGDLDTIRIKCRHDGCGAVTELQADRVEAAMKKSGACCPVCGKPFARPDVEGGADVVTMLAKVILALNGLAGNVGIELPVHVPQ